MKKNDEKKFNKLDKVWMIAGAIALALFTFIVVMA